MNEKRKVSQSKTKSYHHRNESLISHVYNRKIVMEVKRVKCTVSEGNRMHSYILHIWTTKIERQPLAMILNMHSVNFEF